MFEIRIWEGTGPQIEGRESRAVEPQSIIITSSDRSSCSPKCRDREPLPERLRMRTHFVDLQKNFTPYLSRTNLTHQLTYAHPYTAGIPGTEEHNNMSYHMPCFVDFRAEAKPNQTKQAISLV